jgi:hypothetical protein
MYIGEEYQHSPAQPSIVHPACPLRPTLLHCLALALLMLLASTSMWAQINPAPTTFNGMMVSDGGSSTTPYAGDFPGVGSNAGLPFGVYRIWDTDATPSGYSSGYSLAWPDMQTSASTSNSSPTLSTEGQAALALELQNLYTANRDAVAMYTLSRTPYWALSTASQGDTTCNYYNNGTNYWNNGSGPLIYAPGQCDVPADLATANSSGDYTNQTWRNWVTALAQYLKTLTTADGYAQVGYFEIWNEFDRSNFLTGQTNGSNVSYNGNYQQLLRMTEDARCILIGNNGPTGQLTIHNYTTTGGTQSCNTTNFPGGVGLLPNAKITTPSAHAQGSTAKQINQGIQLMQNFFYCNVPGGSMYPNNFPPTSDCNWTATSDWGGLAVDIINFHMKPGNEVPPGGASNQQPEAEMTNEHSSATSIFTDSHEAGLPFMNGEGGYAGDGWEGCSATGCVDLLSYPGEQAAFVARYALIQWSLGFSEFNWYQYDGSTGTNGTSSILSTGTAGSLTLTDPGQAYYDVINWIVGSSMVSGFNCGLVSGSQTGTLWACEFTKSSPSGWEGRVYWDVGAAYACLSADPTPCGTTYSLTVPTAYTYYQTGIGTAQNPISSHKINVSSMPTLVETAKFVENAQ